MQLQSSEQELSEINVTPFIDVMLVLLIIFMVVAPLITSSVKVELPKSAQDAPKDEQKPLIIWVNQKELSLNDEQVSLENLAQKLDEKTKSDKQSLVYFHIDKLVPYERLAGIISAVKGAGYAKIALSAQLGE